MNTQFFTGAGDNGESAMSGKKLSKDDLLFYALGSLDELNSWLGFCRASEAIKNDNLNVKEILKNIQEFLFILQAELYSVKAGQQAKIKINLEKVEYLENIIKNIDEVIPKLDKFVIPGGSELSAKLDYARAISRKAERDNVKLNKEVELPETMLKFLNRLSSALFALARYANYKLNIIEDNPKYL